MENKYKRIVRGAALAVGMLVASAGAWGQQRLGTITPTYDPNRGQSTEILYLSGSKKVELQEGTGAPSDNGGVLNLDGFIRWYIKKADGTETTEGLTQSGNSLTEYQNGYAWLRTDDNVTGEKVTFSAVTQQINGAVERDLVGMLMGGDMNESSPQTVIQKTFANFHVIVCFSISFISRVFLLLSLILQINVVL